MLDKIIPKLLREYMDTDDPARRAELVQVLQDYGAFPRIFEVCEQALSSQANELTNTPATVATPPQPMSALKKNRPAPATTADYFVSNVD